MAYDSYDDDYHLTPRGWDTGDTRPDDTVATWTLSVYQASGWSKEQRGWTRTWVNPNIEQSTIEELYKRFPPRVATASPGSCRR